MTTIWMKYLPYLLQLRTRWIYISDLKKLRQIKKIMTQNYDIFTTDRKLVLGVNPLEDVSTIDVVWLDVSEILQVCRHSGLHSPPWRTMITAIGAEYRIENTTHLTTRYALEAYQETFSSSLQAEYKM